ncbi:MAG: PDZ domain-containing protein [Alphaproteobacteria bacterium]|nr:PDZ domain-containing protein [Alphaproteobacteria bacterium]
MVASVRLVTLALAAAMLCFGAFAQGDIVTKQELTKAIERKSRRISENGAEAVIQKHSDTVVLIHSISNQAEDDGLIYNAAARQRTKKHHYRHGVVSGVMLSKDGIICTTHSGIMNADELIVSVKSEQRPESDDSQMIMGENDYKARLIKTIPELNLAFLKITPPKNLPGGFRNVQLGNDSKLANKKDVVLLNGAVVIGKARGENFTTTVRPANSKNDFKIIAAGIEKLYYEKINGKPTLIAENAVLNSAIIPETEGGAILDMDGRLLGIANMQSDEFLLAKTTAIPVSVIKQGIKIAVPNLLPALDKPSLGITVENLAPEVQGIPKNLVKTLGVSGGVIVKSIKLKSAADAAGLQYGDIILKFNDDVVPNAKTYQNLEEASIGEQNVLLKILRNKRLLDIEIRR